MNTFRDGQFPAASPAKYNHWRAQPSVVQDAAAFTTSVINLTGDGMPEQLHSGQVSAAYFRLFGVPLVLGRAFSPQEDAPRGPRVALISEGLWKRRFGADPQILGKTILLGGDPHPVIGVVASTFDFRDFGPQPDVWIPFQIDPGAGDQGHYFQAAGRVKTGVTLPQARARIVASAAEFERKYPRALGDGNGFNIEPMRDALVRNVRQSLLILAAAVALVLLIACSNVANMTKTICCSSL
jgi:hypothetical protein